MIEFRHIEDDASWFKVHPMVRWLLTDLDAFCTARGADRTLVTSLITDDPKRTADTHKDGRAGDAITEPWLPDVVLKWAERINSVLVGPGGMNVALFGHFDPRGRHYDHIHVQVPRAWVGGWKYE